MFTDENLAGLNVSFKSLMRLVFIVGVTDGNPTLQCLQACFIARTIHSFGPYFLTHSLLQAATIGLPGGQVDLLTDGQTVFCVVWLSAVGIATRYGMEGTGIESRWRRDFPHPVQMGPRAHSASYTMYTGSFTG